MISLICPTRNRPNNIIRFVSSALDTAKNKNLQFCFYVDSDDIISVPTILKLANTYKDAKFLIKNSPRIIMCEMSNILARAACYDLLFLCGDDVVVETKNWDEVVLQEFNTVKDGILVLYGKDGIQNEKLATHPIIHKNWVTTLGYITPPIFNGDWADNWITDIGKELGRLVYKETLCFTHYHPTVGKANFDEVYIEKYNRDKINNSANLIESNKKLMEENIKKLKVFINE